MEDKPNSQQQLHQEYFRGLFEQSPIAIVLCDFNGQVIQANQACLELFDITDKGELKAYNLFKEPNLPETVKQRIKNDESFRIELEFDLARASQAQPGIRPRTGIRYLDAQVSPFRLGDGTREQGYLIQIQDITDRKLKEEQLSHQAYLLENVQDMIIAFDAQYNITYWNPAAEKGYGWKAEEAVGRNAYEIFYRGLVVDEVVIARRKELIATGEFRGEVVQYTKHNTPIYVEAYSVALKDAQGRITGFLSINRDITERKQAEQALNESEERFHRLFEDDLTGDFIAEPDGKILICNPAFVKLFSFSNRETAIGSNLAELHFHREDYHDFIKLIQEQKTLSRYENVRRRCDGTVLYTIENIIGIFNDRDQLIQFKGYIFDDTKRKLREQELHKLNRTLRALNNSSLAMTRAKDESSYLQEVCKIVVEDCGHAMVWIGYAENDEKKTVRSIASAGFDAGYLETLKITWADTERGRGPTGTAIRTGKLSKCQNMLTDPQFKPWREEALKRGYASSIVFPLMEDGKAFGAISIYSREPESFSEEEENLLTELANDLAYGILTIRTRKAQMEAEEALSRSEERYRSLVELSPIAIFINRNNRITYVNPAALKLFGASTFEQLLNKTPFDVFHPDCHPKIRDRIEILQEGQAVPLIEEKILRLDGTCCDVEVTATPFTDSEGRAIQVMLHDITDRKEAEEKLRETRDYLEKLLNYANAPIIVWDPRYKITQFNHAFEHLTGYTTAEVIGQDLHMLFPKDSKEASLQKIARTTSGEFWESVEIPILRKDGSERLALWNSANIYAEDNKTLEATIAQGQDITDRKQAEETATRLASFPTLNPNPVVEVDKTGNVIYMNPAAVRLFPKLNSLQQNHQFIANLPSIDAIRRRKETEALSREIEVNKVWYIQTLYLDKKESRIRIYSHDITQRKHAEEALQQASAVLEQQVEERTHELKQASELLERVFSSTNFLIAYLDKDFNYIRVNEAYEELEGHQPHYYIGKNLFEIYPNKENESIFRQVIKTGEPFNAYTKPFSYGKRSELEMKYWDWSLQPIRNLDGRITGLVFFLIDVSKRKLAEDELLRTQQELMIVKRLSDIGMLAATVAHELRNPLGVIRIAAYNVRRKNKEDSLVKHVVNIEKKVIEADKIIDNLLTYSRLKAPKYEPIVVIPFVEETIKTCENQYATWEVKVKKRFYCKDTDMFEADPIHMTELFSNILNNAYQALPEKNGKIDVTVKYNKKLGNIEFAISDSGTGINADDLDKVFEPFYSKKAKGTGLGLPLCRQIVSLYDGTIAINSKLHVGTTVTISLPITRKNRS